MVTVKFTATASEQTDSNCAATLTLWQHGTMPQNGGNRDVEPWLQQTRQGVSPVPRAVLHALDLARADFERWVWPFYRLFGNETPFALPSLAFQARHIVRSLDRLLTYAEERSLGEVQLDALGAEHQHAQESEVRDEFENGLRSAEQRVLALPAEFPAALRFVGRERIPTTLGGLIVHMADHTQRHAGQAVTTAKVLLALGDQQKSG